MDEIRLLNIIASPSQNVKQPGIADSNSTNLPPIISRFPPGSILAGFVINRDPAGNPILRTENGDITFQSNLFFKIGTELVIRIENRSGHTQAHILTIDGEPPPPQEKSAVIKETFSPQIQAQQRQPAAAPATLINALVRTPAEAATIAIEPTIRATITSNTPELPQGSQLLVKIVSAEAPAQQTTSAQAASTLQQPQPSQSQSATLTPQYAAYARNSAISQQTNLSAPPTAAAPSAITLPPSATSPPFTTGQIIQATVTGNIPTGETVLQASNGVTIQLQTTSPLSQGIKLTFEIGPITQSASSLTQSTNAENPVLPATLARNWASLQQILTLLSENLSPDNLNASGIAMLFGHSSAQSQSGAAININPKAIPTGLMAFIAALRGGDFRGWLGRDNVNRLEEAGHAGLIRKAEAEFMSLGRQFFDVQPGQWQTLFFPLAVNGEIQQLRFFLKRDRKQKDNERQNNGDDTRFIIELDLSQMGELQLDGFVRKDPEKLEFDLYIRSRTQLDPSLQQDIFSIYNKMAELTGFKGQLAFQTVQEFPVKPMDEAQLDHIKDVSV